MIETDLTELNNAVKKEGSGLNYYFTDTGFSSYYAKLTKILAEETSKPKTISLKQLLLLQLRSPRDNKTVLVEFIGTQIRAFGHQTKTGLGNMYKTTGLKCLFESEPGLNLNRVSWDMERLFISPTIHELALHGVLPMILTSSTPNDLCSVQSKTTNGQNVYQPDYCELVKG